MRSYNGIDPICKIIVINYPYGSTKTAKYGLCGMKRRKGGVSDPRNETVMKMFSLIDVGERAGSGIPDFMSTWQKHFGTSPVYTITHNPERTLLTVSVATSGHQ